MDYREIGTTGINISVVGFGGLRIPDVDKNQAIETVQFALDKGINFFETAPGYGKGISEELYGDALYRNREKVILADKTYAYKTGDAIKIRESITDSLIRQKTDYFDLFSFWAVNNQDLFDKVLRPGVFEALVKAKEDGLIRSIGITTHAEPYEILEFVEQLPFDCVTLKYNILTRRMEDVIKKLKEKGIGVVIMTPLAGGMVAIPGGEVKEKLEQAGINPAVLGLRYLTSNSGITSVISGMRHPSEVDINILAGNGNPLSEIESEMVIYVQDKMKKLGEKFCTSCTYCLPCPQSVNIPGVFKLWNIMRGYGAELYSKTEYKKTIEDNEWADFKGKSADFCVECGICETRCPETLPIIEDLKKAHNDMTE